MNDRFCFILNGAAKQCPRAAETMRVLLDTNILIHRAAATVVRRASGRLFFWLDKLKCEKCVPPATLEEIGKHQDARVRSTFETKLQSYHVLKTIAPAS